MRNISDHAFDASERSTITAMDEPSHGGASHQYQIVLPTGLDDRATVQSILFQRGPVGENGVNGITEQHLIAIVIDRLWSFQKGTYASRENALAITQLEQAMHWLHHRTRSRMMRGVEGTSKK